VAIDKGEFFARFSLVPFFFDFSSLLLNSKYLELKQLKATIEAVKAEKEELWNLKANLEDKISQQVAHFFLLVYLNCFFRT
jgi:hypothetical protein